MSRMDKRSASGSAIYIMQSIKNRPFQTHMVGRLLNVPESTAQKQEYENLDTTEAFYPDVCEHRRLHITGGV